jgi:hypothetical protein
MERIGASERTREKLKAVIEGRGEGAGGSSEPARLAARLIIEEALEGEAVGRQYYARGAAPATAMLAVEMDARGLSTRDIEALFADASGKSRLSRTAVSEITERLWAEYEAFASRDLSEFEITYLFVDGIAERLHLGQPREAVLGSILADGKKARRDAGSRAEPAGNSSILMRIDRVGRQPSIGGLNAAADRYAALAGRATPVPGRSDHKFL